jgi:cytochrome c oxidase subunit II
LSNPAARRPFSFCSIIFFSAAYAVAGCRGAQSALDPAGPQADRIRDLYWIFFAVCAAAFAIVVIFTLAAVLRRRLAAEDGDPPSLEPPPETERRLSRAVWVGSIAVVVGLLFLLITTVTTGRAISRHTLDAAKSGDAVRFEITGHQWWWEIHFRDQSPGRNFVTANELHIPAGRDVVLQLTSRDVIHSLWIPRLHGKVDLIPSQKNTMVIRADAPGVYRGQCAEFCGLQHAKMAITVVAEPEEVFRAWVDAQIAPAPEPSNDMERRGREVFMTRSCMLCHAIQGTPAGAVVGPDLTHVAGRMSLAAGELPNTLGHRAGWIVNPQGMKPGNNMPSNILPPDELQALLAYLERLK